MGLETATYISGLTASWPVASDKKNQGDDHLRLIKGVLQNTFPAASKPFYFPTTEASTANMTLDATDNNNELLLDTTGGALTVTLPSTLGADDKGFTVSVVKTSTDTNGITVSASANILSKVGSTATIRIGVPYEPAIFRWNGSAWYCLKPGAVIGATYNWDATATPSGFLDLDGTTYNNTTYAELFAVLATTSLKDKRGRAEIGSGTGSGLTARVLGTNYGAETHVLTTAELANHTHVNTLSDPGHTHVQQFSQAGGVTAWMLPGNGSGIIGVSQNSTAVNTTGITINNAAAGSNSAHNNMQPSVAVKKIIRAC